MDHGKEKQGFSIDIPFFLYFTFMFCFYTKTLVQLAIQFGLILYCGLVYLLQIQKTKDKSGACDPFLIFYILWFGLFTLLVGVSHFWAVSVYKGSKTMMTTFRIFVIGLMLFLYCDSKERTKKVFLSFTLACAIMCVAALATTPVSGYGNEFVFGTVIGQHRNQVGAVAAPLAFTSYWLHRNKYFRFGWVFSVFFAVVTFITGSRTSIVQLFLLCIAALFLEKGSLGKKIGILLSIFGITIIAVYTVPFFHRVIWERFVNAALTQIGVGIYDASISGRQLYKNIAMEMFKQRPLLGFGIDGFICYVRDSYASYKPHLEPVYAHCNYAELAADFGIAGLLIWYIPLISVLITTLRGAGRSILRLAFVVVFFSMIVLDYGRIPWSAHLSMYLYFLVIQLCLRLDE